MYLSYNHFRHPQARDILDIHTLHHTIAWNPRELSPADDTDSTIQPAFLDLVSFGADVPSFTRQPMPMPS